MASARPSGHEDISGKNKKALDEFLPTFLPRRHQATKKYTLKSSNARVYNLNSRVTVFNTSDFLSYRGILNCNFLRVFLPLWQQ
jgi:hypothetical protein